MNKKFLAAILGIICAVILISSCGTQKENITPSYSSNTNKANEEKFYSYKEQPPKNISEETLTYVRMETENINNNIFKPALDLYWAVAGGTASFEIYDNITQTVNGITYYKCNGTIWVGENQKLTAMQSYETFKNYLCNYFSQDIVDTLLDTNVIKNIDGDMYVAKVDRGKNILYYSSSCSVEKYKENTVIYEVTARYIVNEFFDYWDKQTEPSYNELTEEYYEFRYEKVGDKWVFTVFPPIF